VQPELLPGVGQGLSQLTADYKLALIVDTGFAPGRVLRELLRRHDLLDLFAFAYFSDEGAWSKPDRRVFAGVLEELAVDPAEAVHVGDSKRTDIAGAKAAGMLAVQVSGSAAAEAARAADAVVRRFDELPAVVADLAARQRPRQAP